ncbi:MFS transporter [Pseudomonas sp. BMS12]|uniref:MFS transporter n=1 Tax=Pseudomonas sp. BMS12 TaxID=1796033 RepID=UPI00083B35C3|nr:MFS transporter [Pseudomonas sp. BMS12]
MQSPSPTRRRLVIAMLMAVMVISVLDKTIFGFAGLAIMEDLQLSAEQFGFVSSAFFFLYSLSGVLVGFLANRLPTRWILVGMSLVWVTAQLMVTFASSLWTLTASRLLLGAGCGPGSAVTQHATFKWYAPHERVLPGSLVQVALMIGAALGALLLPFSIEHYGWRTVYLALAILSLLWIGAWLLLGGEGPYSENQEELKSAARVPYRHLLLNRTFLWLSLVCFLAYLPSALAFSWTAVYAQKGLGLTPMQNGYLMLTATVLLIIFNLVVPGLSHRALGRGASLQRAMIWPPMLACMLGGLALIALGFIAQSVAAKLVLYVLGSVALNLVFSYSMSITAHISPSVQRGAMLAIHVASLTLSGAFYPWLVGKATTLLSNDVSRGVELILGVSGTVILIAALLGLRMLTPEPTRQRLLRLSGQPDQPLNPSTLSALKSH